MQVSSQIISASAIKFEKCGILLIGNSGSGKSDMCLRAINVGGNLISDDQTIIRKENNQLWADCLPQLQGLLEIRGIGILKIPSIPRVKLDFVIQLQDSIERLPLPQSWDMLDTSLPKYSIYAKQSSAIAVLRQLCKLSNQEAQLLSNNEVLLDDTA
jgi:serine kinase of HPr protein (carbohydrate metabolism regulator)